MLVMKRQKQTGLLEVFCVISDLENLFKKTQLDKELSQVKILSIIFFSLQFKRRLLLDSCLQYKLIQRGPDAPVV